MNERVKKLAEEISKLPPEEQADLIDQLIVLTYRAPDPVIDKAWFEKATRRWERYKSGLDPAYDAFEAVEEIRSRLEDRRRS
jgi:hypothetical protein